MASKISEEEAKQLLRTVEMFEAIAESQPDDFQSLEILKEAYTKLGRQADSLRVSKLLASAYVKLGQFSQAILEYEGILQKCPDDANVLAALAELEAKTAKLGAQHVPGAPSLEENSKPTSPAGTPAGASPTSSPRGVGEDGDRALADLLAAQKLVTPQAVQPLLKQLKTERAAAVHKGHSLTLVQLLVENQIAKLDDILTVLVDKSGLPYLPLSTYDLDRDVVSLLPQQTCFKYCFLPFDLISHSVLIATANPFDNAAREQVRATLEYNVFWYVSPPMEIETALRTVYRLDAKRSVDATAQVKS